MTHSEKAAELFLQGYNCAQAVLAAFSDVTGLTPEYGQQLMTLSTCYGSSDDDRIIIIAMKRAE